MSVSQRRVIEPDVVLKAAAPDSVSESDVGWRSAQLPPGDISDADWRVLQHEVARYIGSMTTELAAMARSARFDLLAYFLDMAHAEAVAQAELAER
jgi:hypothetical protein